jgi:hypothetical protein
MMASKHLDERTWNRIIWNKLFTLCTEYIFLHDRNNFHHSE